MGTPSYMAPEQARGETDLINERADVFALGSILGEILTGSPAFTGRSSGEILRKAARGDTADALARLDGCGAEGELIALAKDCLAVEPEDRPRDAKVVADRITAYLAGVQERVHAAERERAVAVARAIEERRRRKVQLALAASVLAFTTLGGLSTTYYLQQRAERARQLAEQAAAIDRVVGQAETLREQAKAHPEDLSRLGGRAGRRRASGSRRRCEAAGPRLLALRTEVQAGLDAARATRPCSIAWSTSARPRPTTRTARSPTATTPRPSATPGSISPACRRPRRGRRSRLGRRRWRSALAAALDDWAAIRRQKQKDSAGATQLSEAARVADPDPWRNDLRTTLDQSDKAGPAGRLAGAGQDGEVRRAGRRSACTCWGTVSYDAGDGALAESVLRTAQERHPGDVWVNYALGKVLEKLVAPRRGHSLLHRRAIDPARDGPRRWPICWRSRGDSDEAIAVFRDLKRLRPATGGTSAAWASRFGKRG